MGSGSQRTVCWTLGWMLWLGVMPVLAATGEPPVPVLVMTRPTVTQIRNVVELFERDLLPLPRLTLLCVHSDAEETDYRSSREFVKENHLDWIRFQTIQGRVENERIFQENEWTPQFRDLLARSDGLMLPGGADIPPALYGEPTGLLTNPATPRRSLFELSLLFHLVGGARNPGFTPLLAGRKDYLVLAVCLGFQSLNVAAGGTLVQDIPSEIYRTRSVEETLALEAPQLHDNRYLEATGSETDRLASAFHPIRLEEGKLLAGLSGLDQTARPWVLSAHHQALETLGEGLYPLAHSVDGKIVEAVGHRRFHQVLGVQFHPEALELYQKGAMFREKPGAPIDFNVPQFLAKNPPSTAFLRSIWRWVGQNLAASAATRPKP